MRIKAEFVLNNVTKIVMPSDVAVLVSKFLAETIVCDVVHSDVQIIHSQAGYKQPSKKVPV